MKKFAILPIAALALAAACSDSSYGPTAVAPERPLKDEIGNQLDASLDAVAEIMALNVGGPNGTTTLYVTPTNGDGKNGCNLTGGTTLVVSVASSNTSVATVSPSSITFTACGNTPTLTVTPQGLGSATISVSQTSNNTGATFNFAPAAFTVNVAPPANTAPLVAVVGVTGGASYDKGSVPAATCQVTDAEDGPSSFPATLSAVAGPYAADGIGSQTASCSYTDAGGLTAAASETYSIVDPSAPTIGYVLAPASPDGSNGWYRSNVALTWSVAEPESPFSLQKTGCADQNIAADQAETTYSCSATSAGGSAGPVEVKVKRDATAPDATATPSPAAPNGDNGWYRSPVTVSFQGTDATSGIAGCTPDALLGTDGAGQSASGTCTDHAGNVSATATAAGIDIDQTDPSVGLAGGPANGASYYFGSVPAAPTCNASDATSGVDSCVVSGYGTTVGTHTVTATAKDRAGNQATASATYTVLAWTLRGFYQPVDMNGVYNTVKAGSTVPFKFNVFAGATELTATSAVKSFTPTQVVCASGAAQDDIELTTTGGTSLRYDATAGQFVQNWQTPRAAGTCYRVTVTTQDGSSISALFRLK